MKTVGNNPKSIWNMVPETAEESEWLEAQKHTLTCHDPKCSYCQRLHDKARAATA